MITVLGMCFIWVVLLVGSWNHLFDRKQMLTKHVDRKTTNKSLPMLPASTIVCSQVCVPRGFTRFPPSYLLNSDCQEALG